jgi:hypothetical protein
VPLCSALIARFTQTADFACFAPARRSHYPFRGLLGVHSLFWPARSLVAFPATFCTEGFARGRCPLRTLRLLPAGTTVAGRDILLPPEWHALFTAHAKLIEIQQNVGGCSPNFRRASMTPLRLTSTGRARNAGPFANELEKEGSQLSVASFRPFRLPKAWVSKVNFANGSTCCEFAIENCGPLFTRRTGREVQHFQSYGPFYRRFHSPREFAPGCAAGMACLWPSIVLR